MPDQWSYWALARATCISINLNKNMDGARVYWKIFEPHLERNLAMLANLCVLCKLERGTTPKILLFVAKTDVFIDSV